MAGGGTTKVEVAFDVPSRRLIERIAKGLERVDKEGPIFLTTCDHEPTTHDSETLKKVWDAIHKAVPSLDEEEVSDIITGMQNNGILFRERVT